MYIYVQLNTGARLSFGAGPALLILRRNLKMKEKVVLAYSGGLDTTAIIPWLKENFGYEVICCCIDCGQGNELDGLDERAKLSGASKLYIEDLVDEFADNYIMPCVKADAVYENKYLLGTSMARPAIAKKLVEIARKEGAVAICHGATGKGNDQIRFELGIKALAPDIKIIAPWRMTDIWTMQSREDEIAYCEKHGKGLEDLTAEEFAAASPLFEADIVQDLDPAGIANARVTYGGTGHDAVVVQLDEARASLEEDERGLR